MPFYAGFETAVFPGRPMMAWLRQNTNLQWCGYYLEPAPNRSPSGWTGQYAALAPQWGIAPIYVGQQEPSTGNGSRILTAAQGQLDARHAADLAAADHIPARHFIFLDWEAGDIAAAGASAYIGAWISGLVADGRYQPGVYCSHLVAAGLMQHIVGAINPAPPVRLWCWKVSQTDTHAFTGSIAHIPELDPAGSGVAAATIWQRENNAVITLPHGAPLKTLEVDFDTARLASPGAP